MKSVISLERGVTQRSTFRYLKMATPRAVQEEQPQGERKEMSLIFKVNDDIRQDNLAL